MPETLDTQALKEMCLKTRLDILDMTTKAGSGHVSSSYSSVEIVTALFFGGILNYRADEPDWPNRDRFIMSKGHAAPLLYATLAYAGYFDREEIWRLRDVGSPVQGHPIKGLMPGVEATTGSLGQGLSFGVGTLLGARMEERDYRAYVLMGDGECEAGQVWEAAMSASHFGTTKLIAILDYNKYQEMGPISREMGVEPLVQKWESFGWHVEEVDGHDIEAVIAKLTALKQVEDKPSILIAHTVKGKGVSFLEADYTWHGRAVTKPEQVEQAREELKNGIR